MMNALRKFIDRRLGRGEAAITVPNLDGPLLPNQRLEEADVFAALDAADNLIATEKELVASSGTRLLRYDWAGGEPELVCEFPQEITAIAAAKGMLAIGLDGGGVVLRGGSHDGRRFESADGTAFICPTALAFLDAKTLLLTLGSTHNPASAWRRDLMEKRSSGSLWKINIDSGEATCVTEGLAWAGGVATTGSLRVYVTESWKHRILAVDLNTGAREVVHEHLAAYPARISPAFDAGYWLGFYSVRNQLVEFILNEDVYRNRMLAEVPEPCWMAPALSSGQSFREPMQGSQLKQMGVLKPFAATRSYGLVVRCDKAMVPLESFHSRADGTAHGTVSACERGDDVFVASRGGHRILRLKGVINGH